MADGYLNFDTKINESGFNKGISNLSKIATTGLGVAVGNAITKLSIKSDQSELQPSRSE